MIANIVILKSNYFARFSINRSFYVCEQFQRSQQFVVFKYKRHMNKGKPVQTKTSKPPKI